LVPFIKLIDKFDAEYDYITNEGTVFTFKTNLDASRYRVITIDFENPGPENWKTLIPEHPTDVLENITCVNQNKLIVIYMHDVKVLKYWYFIIEVVNRVYSCVVFFVYFHF